MFRFPGNLSPPATVAVFDCGTNSLLLTVARLGRKKGVRPLFEAIETPRLGEGLAGKGKLKPEAVARTLRSLKKLERRTGRFNPDYSIIVGTNIFRRAANGAAVARYLEKRLGIPVSILSAGEEARFEFLGAIGGFRQRLKAVAIDVGGGSSEVVWGGHRKIQKKISLEIGAVQFKEKLGTQTRYSPQIWQKMHREASRKIKGLKPSGGYDPAILTGGTATTLAAFHLGLKTYRVEKVHGLKLARPELEKRLRQLAAMTLSERRRALPFDPSRADIIVPGAIILVQILRKLKIERVRISHRGLRWGVLHRLTADLSKR
jgi:exopolyphosphatase/guanosine-5'-triphosphate,3'-diphosphate pyrophosphatase